jgi:ABC-type amino acid transport substrate-binding protein
VQFFRIGEEKMSRKIFFVISIVVVLSLFIGACAKTKETTVKSYDDIGLAFQDLMNSQIDAVIADNPLALQYVSQNADKLKTVGDVFTDESYGIAVCNQKPELVQKLNEGLQAVKAEGLLESLSQKWLGSELPSGQSALPATTTGTEKITVATDATWPPFEYLDENTKAIIGFDVDLMSAIAGKVGLQLEFINVTWDSLLAGMATCQYDTAISAMTITEERKQQFSFSDPYFSAGQIVTVRIDEKTINGYDDLVGKIIGAQLGTTGDIEAKKLIETPSK